jgi:hypothetical protein
LRTQLLCHIDLNQLSYRFHYQFTRGEGSSVRRTSRFSTAIICAVMTFSDERLRVTLGPQVTTVTSTVSTRADVAALTKPGLASRSVSSASRGSCASPWRHVGAIRRSDGARCGRDITTAPAISGSRPSSHAPASPAALAHGAGERSSSAMDGAAAHHEKAPARGWRTEPGQFGDSRAQGRRRREASSGTSRATGDRYPVVTALPCRSFSSLARDAERPRFGGPKP